MSYFTKYNGEYVPGINEVGKLKFNLKNKEMFDIALEAFVRYSKYKTSVDALNYFLQAVEITSSREAGFDGINTWDNAGISCGFIGFAFPNGECFRLLNDINPNLANEVKNAFGPSQPYNDAKSIQARQNIDLIKRVQNAIITRSGIDKQFKRCIEIFFDKAYEKFLTFKFKSEFLSTETGYTKSNPFQLYAMTHIFDVIVNRGVATLNRFNSEQIGIVTEGNFLRYYVEKFAHRPERKAFWREIINTKFKTYNGKINPIDIDF